MAKVQNDRNILKQKARGFVRPLVEKADQIGMTPLAISLIGMAITVLAGWIVSRGHLFFGALIFLVGSAFDMLDGDLARLQGTVSKRGAFLDSCFDRLGESALFAGLTWYFITQRPENWQMATLMIVLTVVGSLTTSYVRARAEGVGETCYVGLLQRPERVIILTAGMIFGSYVLALVLVVLAALTLTTTVQRIVHVAGKLPGPEPVVGAESVADPDPVVDPVSRPGADSSEEPGDTEGAEAGETEPEAES
jgi:phosphatidylglycerophosphate synthase